MSSSSSSTARSHLLLIAGGVVLVVLAWFVFQPVKSTDTLRMDLDRGGKRTLTIAPAAPATFNELSLSGLPNDLMRASLDGAPGPHPASRDYRVTWSVNGRDVGIGKRLGADQHRRGDLVEARLERIAPNGSVIKEIGRASTTIVNAEPIIRSVTLRRPAERPSLVEAVVDVADPDGDLVELEYRWLVGGEEHDRADDAVAYVDGLGDRAGISLDVTARDSANGYASYTTAELELSNRPPQLDFGKNAHLRQDNDGARWAALDVRASDPDGDPVQVTLVNPPGGFAFDPGQNWIRWTLDDGTTPYDVIVRVSDGRGGAVERTVTVNR